MNIVGEGRKKNRNQTETIMSHAHTISTAYDDSNLALEAARTIGIFYEDLLWGSDTTVVTLSDGSRIAFSESDVWEVVGRKQEMIVELMEAKERGVSTIWYGNIENAEPVKIDDAIADITKMDEDLVGDGEWGEWDAITYPLLGDECDHDGGCDSCSRNRHARKVLKREEK